MNRLIASLSAALLKETDEQNRQAELESLSSRYPYFGPAQLLKAALLKKDQAPGYEKQARLASLYFQHPLWLSVLMEEEELEQVGSPAELIVPELPEEEEIQTQAADDPEADAAYTQPQNEPADRTAASSESEDLNERSDSALSAEAAQATETADTVEKAVPAIADPVSPAQNPEIEPVEESEAVFLREEHSEEPALSFEQDDEPVAPAISEENIQKDQREQESFEEEENDEEEDRSVPLPAIPGLKLEPIDPSNTDLPAFQPFFTVDYFASQGIEAEEKPTDRFGRQLRSFTEWLKTMKKIPQTDLEMESLPSKAVESVVENLAAASNTEKQVVTETMAEVWLKQGNTHEAIEVYRKLSLLNPDKSAYFAALIEKIKA